LLVLRRTLLEGQVPVFISPRNSVAQICPRHWVLFPSPLTTRRDYGGGILTCLHTTSLVQRPEEVEVEVNLRPTVSQPVCPGVKRPSGTRDQVFFLLEISFRQLRLCYFVAPSLTRGRICNLLVQLLLGLSRAAALRSKSRRTHGPYFTVSFEFPSNLEGQVPVFISPRNREAQLYPRTLGFLSFAS
jgi:hypothetical protein